MSAEEPFQTLPHVAGQVLMPSLPHLPGPGGRLAKVGHTFQQMLPEVGRDECVFATEIRLMCLHDPRLEAGRYPAMRRAAR